jgi:hypothetical protein
MMMHMQLRGPWRQGVPALCNNRCKYYLSRTFVANGYDVLQNVVFDGAERLACSKKVVKLAGT